MKESTYNSFYDLPLFLNAETAAALLGVSISSMYELMHEKGFPVLRVGSRLVIPKDKLRAWVEQNTGE
jgi:excisionase family DNA binding protein